MCLLQFPQEAYNLGVFLNDVSDPYFYEWWSLILNAYENPMGPLKTLSAPRLFPVDKLNHKSGDNIQLSVLNVLHVINGQPQSVFLSGL